MGHGSCGHWNSVPLWSAWWKNIHEDPGRTRGLYGYEFLRRWVPDFGQDDIWSSASSETVPQKAHWGDGEGDRIQKMYGRWMSIDEENKSRNSGCVCVCT